MDRALAIVDEVDADRRLLAEENLRRSLDLSDGSLDIFYTRPITMAILILAVLSLFSPYIVK